MSRRDPVWRIARVVLEAQTPLSITTGTPDGAFDTRLVTDANGLPAIPGTSVAGVLRHLWTTLADDSVSATEEMFGVQRGDKGRPSRVETSWGALVDSQGHPAEGLLLGEQAARLRQDPVLAAAARLQDDPAWRHRVRLSERGAAAGTGKFDRSILPAGHRFALELRLRGGTEADWERLLGLLNHPLFRLGGSTRSGLGRMRPVRVHIGTFLLDEPQSARRFTQLSQGLAEVDGLEPCSPDRLESPDSECLEGTLVLTARGYWRLGQGLPRDDTAEKPADLLPVTEPRIEWSGGRGQPGQNALLFAASSLKGALAHRMSFHADRHAQRWAGETAAGDEEGGPAPEVRALLGEVKGNSDDGAAGHAGCLYLDDAWAPLESERLARLMHIAIDRFTGGVRDRVLYDEEAIHGGAVRIPVTLDCRALRRRTQDKDSAVLRALNDTLRDLGTGQLALGSRTTTGNGFFTGRLEGPLGEWLEQQSIAARGSAA
ncbi:RAMP superfamily CRISPR-associated protein [Thioalkalivibrio sp. AKL10]|uniref:RAMP superfamily CRISPR-associated protein n=1 Tax=Thioalkalivibrio sp. AKL10 TaxID=1158158 RepID=UPI0003718466|nr:RAMP superfamily CRISPR-associated protein [Thioalkalivibrio sp. AKL10]